MLQVWGRASSINVQKVLWALGELGLDHIRHDAGGRFGGLDSEEFGRMNPHRRVPVLDDDGTVVWESHAILRYLAAKYGAGTLWPEDPAERAAGDQWIEWAQTALQTPFLRLFVAVARTPPAKQNVQRILNGAKYLESQYRMLDRRLEGRAFVAGDRLTMADIPAGVTLYRYYKINIPRAELPNLAAWHERLREREAFRCHVEVPW